MHLFQKHKTNSYQPQLFDWMSILNIYFTLSFITIYIYTSQMGL